MRGAGLLDGAKMSVHSRGNGASASSQPSVRLPQLISRAMISSIDPRSDISPLPQWMTPHCCNLFWGHRAERHAADHGMKCLATLASMGVCTSCCADRSCRSSRFPSRLPTLSMPQPFCPSACNLAFFCWKAVLTVNGVEADDFCGRGTIAEGIKR